MSDRVAIAVYVDWDRDGSFATAADDISAYVKTVSWNNGMRKAFQDVADDSMAAITLDNSSRLFSPENAGGALYGKLAPQRPVRIDVVYRGAATTMWRGWLNQIAVDAGDYGEREARLECTGAKAFLQATKLHLDLMENVTADTVLTAIFEQVLFPPALAAAWLLGVAGFSELGVNTFLADTSSMYAFETGMETFAYVADNWHDNIDAYRAIGELMAAERGRFFFDRSGKAIFWSRRYLQLKTSVDATFDTRGPIEAYGYTYGDHLANQVLITCYPRHISAAATDTLWQLEEAFTLKPGEARDLRAIFKDDSGATIGGDDVVTPNTGDGSLVYTGSVSLAFSAQARGATLTVTNTDTTAEATVTTLVIKGKKMTAFRAQEAEARDGTSASFYGQREYSINASLLDDFGQAWQIANYELARRKDPRGELAWIRLTARDAAAIAQMIALEIGDRITVTESQTGHSDDYIIVGEEPAWSAGGTTYKTTLYLESASSAQFWLLGVAGYSELGTTTYLGF